MFLGYTLFYFIANYKTNVAINRTDFYLRMKYNLSKSLRNITCTAQTSKLKSKISKRQK